MCAATRRAPSSSPSATLGETAVTASARSPRARYASAATTDESTPPENATTALPSEVKGSGPLSTGMGFAQGLGPDRLDGRVGGARDALAVGVLGRQVHHAPVEPADLDADG